MNPTINQAVIMARIGKKVVARFDYMRFVQAPGTQAVLRCRGIVVSRGASFRLSQVRPDGVPLAN